MHATRTLGFLALALLLQLAPSVRAARWSTEHSQPLTVGPYMTAARVIDDSALNSYVIGSFYVPLSGDVVTNGYSIRKYDGARQLLWETQLVNGVFGNLLQFSSVTPQGDLLLGGSSLQLVPSPYQKGLVVWCRADGGQMFTNRFNIEFRETAVLALAGDSAGKILVVANMFQWVVGGTVTTGRSLLKLTVDGTILWRRDLPLVPAGFTSDSSFPPQLALDSADNVYVSVAAMRFMGEGPAVVRTHKFSPDGEMLWNRDLTQRQFNFPQGLLIDQGSNVVVSIFSWNARTNSHRAQWSLASYDSAGALRWQRSIAQASARSLFRLVGPQALATDENNSIYLCTTRAQSAHPDRGLATVTALSPKGRIRSRKRLPLLAHPYFESPIAFTAATAQSLTLRHHVIQEFEEEPQTVDWITSTFTYENPR
jgi:hypothetical protein